MGSATNRFIVNTSSEPASRDRRRQGLKTRTRGGWCASSTHEYPNPWADCGNIARHATVFKTSSPRNRMALSVITKSDHSLSPDLLSWEQGVHGIFDGVLHLSRRL